jgi:serine/threonine protein kinase
MADRPDYCPNCFKHIGVESVSCPYCNYKEFERDNPLALKMNTVLKNRYIAGKILGAGGFGITYKGLDMESGTIVAIKEYVPLDSARRDKDETTLKPTSSSKIELFEYGKKKFLDEARTLRELRYVPDVVDILDYFSENGTAYFVMEYLNGSTLNHLRQINGGHLPYSIAYEIIISAATTMEEIHTKGNIFHRDISPENIIITKDLKVKMIDFGTAKYIHGKKSQNLSIILKPGYAPPEQYVSNSKQGAYTDVYALTATFYYVLTGEKIPPAPDRMGISDENTADFKGLQEFPFLGPDYTELNEVMVRALKPRPKERTRTMGALIKELKQFNDHMGEKKPDTTGITNTPTVENGTTGEEPSVTEIPLNPYLQGMSQPIWGYRYHIPPNTIITVGRSSASNIRIPINVIGRKHLELFYDTFENLFYVVDNHSVNKTVLNGTVCTPGKIYPARPGSYLSLAHDSCVFKLEIK